jgi:hypothetical protein
MAGFSSAVHLRPVMLAPPSMSVDPLYHSLSKVPVSSGSSIRLTTHWRRVPQGTPTGQTLANVHLRFSDLVSRLSGLAKKSRLNVKRNGCDVKVDSLNVKLNETHFLQIAYCFLMKSGYIGT